MKSLLYVCLLGLACGCTACSGDIIGPDWSQIEVERLSPNVVLWNGTAWMSLGQGLDSLVSCVAWAPDGALYAGGYFVKSGDRDCLHIARWNGRDSSWEQVGGGVNGTVHAITYDEGSLIVGGLFSEAYNPDGTVVRADCLARWDGQSWHAFNAQLTDYVRELIATHGSIFAGGTSKLYCLDAAGLAVEELAIFESGARALAVYGDSLLIGGWFDESPYLTPSGVTILNLRDTSWRLTNYLATRAPSSDDLVWDLTVLGSTLYMGGTFWIGNDRSVAAVDLATGVRVPMPGLEGGAYAIAADADYVYAGGQLWRGESSGAELIRVARFNVRTRSWEPMGRGLAGVVNDICVTPLGVVFSGSIGGRVK